MSEDTINGIRIYHESAGSGRPVLFIHGGYGGPGSSLMPVETPAILDAIPTSEARLIWYDRRSAGRSEYVMTEFNLEDLAADASGVLDHLGIGEAVIVGASAGGPIALFFALTWPDRVTALALLNTGSGLMAEPPEGFSPPYPERIRKRFTRVRSFMEQVEGARRIGDRIWFEEHKESIRNPKPAPGASQEDAENTRQLKEALSAIDDETLFAWHTGMLRNYGAYEGMDFTSRLGEISAPTFIAHGTADLAVPIEYSELLHERIPGSVYHTIAGAGHGISNNPAAHRLLKDWILSL